MSTHTSIFYRKNYDPYFLLLGHTCCDMNQGALPAILAFLYYHNVLTSLESIAWFVFAANMISAVVQPLVGYASDRYPRPWLMTAGILTASVSTAAIGFIHDHSLLMLCCLVNGIGIAVFHPAGGKTAHAVVPSDHLGRGLSLFYVGGNLGFAIGPILVTIAMTMVGTEGTAVLLIPGILITGALMYMNAKFVHAISREKRQTNQRKMQGTAEKERVGAFCVLTVAIFFRATIFFAINTFIPIFWVKILGKTVQEGNAILSIIAVMGAIATLCGGILADRIGVNKVFSYALTAISPLLIAFCCIQNEVVNILLIVPTAFFLYATSAPMMAIGQRFLCNHTGLASGITVGLAVSFGGITAPLLGRIGDLYGLIATFGVIASCACCAMVVSYLIPQAAAPATRIPKEK
ncbi:MAG: MFS transporter [Succinivibrionaceae bacterium]|nr:MFS transporter [Succinivibrionaceae bacterium]